MKKIIFFAIAVIVFCSCNNKKESEQILATIDTTSTVRTDTISMEAKTVKQQVRWGDASYTVEIERLSDHSLPVVTDQQDNHYYDNKIAVVIDGPQGQLLNRSFRKSDFQNYVNPQYVSPKHSVLSSIAFKAVANNTLQLVASVGSPEETDDNYMLIQLTVDKHGSCAMKQIDANEE